MANIEKLKAKKNVKALKDLLSHKKEKVREEACEALGTIGYEASPLLVTTLGERLHPGLRCSRRPTPVALPRRGWGRPNR